MSIDFPVLWDMYSFMYIICCTVHICIQVLSISCKVFKLEKDVKCFKTKPFLFYLGLHRKKHFWILGRLKSKCINVLPTLLWMVITKHWISSQCQGKNSLIIWKAIESLIRNKARLPKLQLIFGVCFFSSWTLKSCTCLSKLIYQNDLSLFPSISTEQVKRGEVTLLGQNDNEPCWLQKKQEELYLMSYMKTFTVDVLEHLYV